MMTDMAEEVELKLELTPEVANAVEAAGLFSGEPQIVRQYAVYFDTPDHALFGAGLSLRIRRNGDVRVQTIKVDGGAAAGLFVRSEWEREVEGDTPIVDDTTPIPALIGEKVADIAPLFAVENERRLWNGDGIEIALDRGRVIAGEREAPFSEVELEQKGGDASALFALARRIDAVAPVNLGVLSKAERGYRLLLATPSASKAPPVALMPAMTAEASFQMIARACLRHFRLNAPLIRAHQDAGLHQARIALRQLRSALSIHKPMLTDGRAHALNEELRWLAGELGHARDLDVLIKRAGHGPPLERLRDARAHAYMNAISALESDRGRAVVLDVAEWITIGGWLSRSDNRDVRDLPAREFAGSALDRFRRKLKKSGRNLDGLDDEARHDVRKAAKTLRYAADFFAALYRHKRERRRHARFISRLASLQEELGVLNDLVSAPGILHDLGLADDPHAAKLLGTGQKDDLLKAAADAYDALVDAKRFWR